MITAQRLDQVVKESKASQNKEELRELLMLLVREKVKIRHILEIGVHLGNSMEVWQKAFKPATLVGIDWDIKSLEVAAKKNLDAKLITGNSGSEDSVEMVKSFLPKGIDFLFIDGNHEYRFVKKDFELYSPMVNEGGVIVLHDVALIGNITVEVYRFWEELTRIEEYYDLIHNGGTGYGVVWR